MKKICLSIVLSAVSVFSISAQIKNQPTDPTMMPKAVKSESGVAQQTGAVESSGKTTETDVPSEKKPAASGEVKPAPVASPVAEPVTKSVAEPLKAAATSEPVVKSKTSALDKTAALPEQPKGRVIEPGKEEGLSMLSVTKASLGGLSTGNAAIDGYIEEFSTLYNIDPLLIYAQMSQESSFNGRATSYKGASGYMQLMPDTARRFGVTNIYNPKQNIKAGVRYMRWLLDKFGGDMRLALAGYNAGEGAVLKHGNKVPPYRETQNYVTRIMNHYDLLSTQGLVVAKIGE